MRRFARRRPRRPVGDDGLTLVELLVTMIVFSIAIVMVYSALLLVQEKVQDVETASEVTSQARHALAQIDRQVRSGNVLLSPADEPAQLPSCTSSASNSGTCMRVYTQANGTQRCVQWQLLADPAAPGTAHLRSRSWQTDWQVTGVVSGWSTVARGLDLIDAPFVLEGASTPYNRRLLNVRLEATDVRRGDPVILTSSLSGRNTNYGYDTGLCDPVPPA